MGRTPRSVSAAGNSSGSAWNVDRHGCRAMRTRSADSLPPEDKQILLMQSTETIEKLKNSLEEQRKSWMRTTIISSIVSAAIGLLIGALLL